MGVFCWRNCRHLLLGNYIPTGIDTSVRSIVLIVHLGCDKVPGAGGWMGYQGPVFRTFALLEGTVKGFRSEGSVTQVFHSIQSFTIICFRLQCNKAAFRCSTEDLAQPPTEPLLLMLLSYVCIIAL